MSLGDDPPSQQDLPRSVLQGQRRHRRLLVVRVLADDVVHDRRYRGFGLT
jgi:hypothetical protein